MCGFAAIVGRERPEEIQRRVQAMVDAQVHRGPDDEGVWTTGTTDGGVGLGARRLAIIDLSPAGHQPMVNRDTGDVLAYNGEIYNAPELRTELEAKGVAFAGHSDTEVLLRGYEAWGRDVLDRLRGMFAFGLWDARRQILLLARDHLGIKPLYYTFAGRSNGHDASAFVAASEIRALLASELIDARIERRALAGYFAYGAVQEPFTILQDVLALPAGSWLEVGSDGGERARGAYWSIPEPDESIAAGPDIAEQGRVLLERSVARHLLSDVPLGVFLSSGLDSTTVAGLAARASDSEVHAFTVSMPEDESLDERPVAQRAAARLGLQFHDIPVDSSTALDWIQGGLAAMDQPAMDGMNTYIVSRAVRGAGLTVALSGQGGDEVFGGYRSFQAVPRLVPLTRAIGALPAPIRRLIAEAAARPWGKGASKRAGDLAQVGPDPAGLTLIWRRLFSDGELSALGYHAGALGLSSHFLDTSVSPNGARQHIHDAVTTVGRLETRFYLGNTLLRDGDVYGMANSLEIRVPMLDRDVVDWAFRLPGRVLAPRGAPPKSVLRTIARDLLAEEQLRAPKRGFGLPFALWLEGPLAQLRRDSLAALAASGSVDPAGIELLERRYLADDYRSAWTRVWALVMLGHWLGTNSARVRV
ncbi:MAG: asparagine synthase (glutamine-hydrolyzing) [Actinomycetota bacterium]|nr:asparagine synthase (glutamine-hydrolyzing) [Actinomycetota bacterium]